MGKYYVYKHTRLDTNEIFYIGIGTQSKRNYKTFVSKYYRAHKKQGRNQIWQRIVNKTDYTVEIIFESDSYELVKEKEIILIKSLGKKINNRGTLCNITDGGDGTLGHSKPKGKDSKFSKKIYQYDKSGNFIKEWDCGKDIEIELGVKSNSIYNCCNGKNETALDCQWSYVKTDKLVDKTHVKPGLTGRGVVLFNKNGEVLKEFDSINDACKHFNIPKENIYQNLSGRSKKTRQGVWKYK